MLDTALSYIGYFFFYVSLGVGLGLIPMGLPGAWIILGTAIVYGLIAGFHEVTLVVLLSLGGLAALGEIVELFLGLFTAKKFGASKWGMLGTFVGGILGVIFGTALLPVIGTLLGGFAGAFLGAFLLEMRYRKQFDKSLKAGYGAFLGRIFALVTKFTIGIIMVVILLKAIR